MINVFDIFDFLNLVPRTRKETLHARTAAFRNEAHEAT